MSESGLDADGIRRFLDEHFPQALDFPVAVREIGARHLTLELEPRESFLRPGATISGPTLMTLVDTAAFFLLLAKLGPVAQAVTTSLHIDFLKRPKLGHFLAVAELMKLGRTLAVVRVVVYPLGDEEAVAQASVTYSLPRSQS